MKRSYSTNLGSAYCTDIESFIDSTQFRRLQGRVDLILTSPPYPLLRQKAYGNRLGEEYQTWLAKTFVELGALLAPHGSLVVEIGNAWEKGQPTMSTLPVETLLRIKQDTGFHVCQQFVWQNPNKIPGPAQWVNIDRVRVKDSFTHIWWYAPDSNPRADNRKVLVPYAEGMEKLLARQTYNKGPRPSGHDLGDGFLKRHDGAIPSSVLSYSNSKESQAYRDWCRENKVPQHPARMPMKLAEFFVSFLTNPGDLVFEPFAGSNTTGAAAEALGRKWVRVERDENYVLGSRGRFARTRP